MQNSRPAEELYDTQADPHQIHDLADHPEHRATLERMRSTVTEWMTRIDDQGLINEPEMIHRMWPGGVQPVTAAPYIFRRGSTNWQSPAREPVQTFTGPTEVEIYVPTQGASIGYTTEAGPDARWSLYTGPFRLTGAVTIRAKAIRYGYRESEETVVIFTQAAAPE